jgi:hypothetical protein
VAAPGAAGLLTLPVPLAAQPLIKQHAHVMRSMKASSADSCLPYPAHEVHFRYLIMLHALYLHLLCTLPLLRNAGSSALPAGSSVTFANSHTAEA